MESRGGLEQRCRRGRGRAALVVAPVVAPV